MSFADVALVSHDPYDVVRILLGQVAVGVVERSAHLVGVLLVDAEDDGLAHAAVSARHEVAEVLGRRVGAGQQRDHAFEVLCRVEVAWDLLAEQVELALVRCPPVRVGAQDDASDPVGREKAVVDALREGVLVQRTPEVVVRVDRVIALGCRGHPELGR